uniref:HSPB1 associated protein 1 n=1 Tax=Leptobrachium leishanense TaxID=445787 RepID=A0A8C5QM78_9ANUR
MEPEEAAGAGFGPKPFAPQEAREIILTLSRPAIFTDMASDWPASHWTVGYLSNLLGGNHMRFRIGRRHADPAPQFETDCPYIQATLQQFQDWIRGASECDTGTFQHYNISDYWAYADYKYLAQVFGDRPQILKDVVWADFGFPGRDGMKSTLWVGSSGANTPCHIDSYGCNLVLQVEGRKTWHLFPPEDTAYLYPTRIPYEESSVFSKVNVLNPDWRRLPLFSKAHPHVVTLHPGQVLFVPSRWWHYVESVDDITVSVNTWIELDSDHAARVEEAVTRMVVCAFKSTSSSVHDWLNPTEDEVTSHETNLLYLNQALVASAEHRARRAEGSCRPQSPASKKAKLDADEATDLCTQRPPFGKHLLPVAPGPPAAALRGEDAGSIVCGEDCAQPPNHSQDAPQTPQGASDPGAPPASQTVSSDEVLDCLVNPRVIRLVTQLLLEKQIP